MKKTVIGLCASVLILTSLSARERDYASSHYKYIALYEQGKSAQHIRSTMGLDTFREMIREEWDQGYDITDIKYGNGKWIGLFSVSKKNSHQTYVVGSRWSSIDHVLKEYWDQGYYMTKIEHGLADWIVVFEKNTGYTNQSYERRKTLDAFTGHVEKRWKEGYDLIDLEYGQGRWTGVFAEGTGYQGQAMVIRSRWSDMVPVIEAHWKKGYSVSDIEQTLGKWMVVFSKTKEQKAQGYETSPTVEKLRETFVKRQEDGFKLIDLAEGW